MDAHPPRTESGPPMTSPRTHAEGALRTFLNGANKSIDLAPQTSLFADGIGLDSLETAELSAVLEDTLGQDPFSSGDQMPQTVGEVLDFYGRGHLTTPHSLSIVEDYDPAAHYDRVTEAWGMLLGDELHYGLFFTGDETLSRPRCAHSAMITERRCALAAVLDMGCGSGDPACRLAEQHGGRARDHHERDRRELPRSRAVRGSLARAGAGSSSGTVLHRLADESFDRVWVMESSHLMPDRAALIRECARVLRPQGRLVLCDLIRRREIPFLELREKRHEFAILRAAFGAARMDPSEEYARLAEARRARGRPRQDLTAPTRPTFARWKANSTTPSEVTRSSAGRASRSSRSRCRSSTVSGPTRPWVTASSLPPAGHDRAPHPTGEVGDSSLGLTFGGWSSAISLGSAPPPRPLAFGAPPAAVRAEHACLTHPSAQQCLYRVGQYRLAGAVRTLGNSLIGADFGAGMVIGSGFYLAHPVGVTLGWGARVGDNVTFAGGVVLAARYYDADHEGEQSFPIVEDGATLGAHAVVVGGVRVGRNATVGANTVVLSDVPDNTVVLGVPPAG